ncbi:hypothetical protein INR49_021178 [Caranx melampygus]|nr:hypothetical protein INR49_021178 [Caranx melampygus]
MDHLSQEDDLQRNGEEVSSKSEGEQKDLIEIESLDLVFETSVDGSDVDSGDMDAFFKQLDSEGQVYWAEPIQLSKSGSFEASDRSFGRSLSSSGSAAPDTVSSTDKYKSSTMDTDQNSRNTTDLSDAPSSLALAPNMSSPATPHLRPSSRSVSVQMPSSPSSHIVQRKDVPYMIDSKCNFLPSIRQLDTSSPFRAVQEWTDMQIQRNNLLKKLSQGAVHAVPNEVSISVGSSRTIRRPALIYSSSPSLPLLSNDWESNDCLPGIGRNYHAVSVSVDGGLWLDKDEDVDRHGSADEEKLWEGNQTATMTCCCSCDHQYACCNQRSYNKQHSQGSMPYSLADLEDMMLCLQQFRSVLSNMEEQLSEDQAAVYSDLSDQDRENIQDIEELRRAVKQEAKELEMQLNELAHYYDHSLKMRMDRLLDEQSLLCSQLGVFQPAAAPTSSSSTPNRTVATQCCLLPCVAPAPDVHSEHVSSWSTWNTDSARQSPPESESACNGLGCSPTKTDKLDIVGFLQKMRTSHHDLWENNGGGGLWQIMDAEEEGGDAPPPSLITQSHSVQFVLCHTAQTEKPQRSSEITTGYMSSTIQHRLMTQEGKQYQDALVDMKSVISDNEDKEEAQEDDQLKKPRRKDTPILNCPPHIPGVRLLKAEKQVVHLEEEEKI